MTKPLVVLAMTAFNREEFISEAIESVLAQTFSDWILNIVDDGSTDSTFSIIVSYVHQDDRIRVTQFPENKGIVEALREASKLECQYLGWIDSDDLLNFEALKLLVPYLIENPDVDCVYSRYNTITALGVNTGLGHRCLKSYSPNKLLTNFMVFHFRLMKWDSYLDIGLDDSFYYAFDYDFFLRFSEKYLIEHFPQSLYCYRQHPKSISTTEFKMQATHAEAAINAALVRRNLSDQFQLTVNHNKFSLEAK